MNEAHTGVVRDQSGGFVQRTGGVAVTVGLDLLSTERGNGEQLPQGRHVAAGRVGVLDELVQDRGELLLVDVVGAEVVLDLLEGQRGDPDRCADAVDARAGRRPRSRCHSARLAAASASRARAARLRSTARRR